MSFALCLLAQAENAPAVKKIWIGLAAILVIAFLVGIFATWLRRRAMTEPGPSIGFTLADLRQMRDEGQISEEEFQTAKAKQVSRTKAALLEDEEAKKQADNSDDLASKTASLSAAPFLDPNTNLGTPDPGTHDS